MVLQVFILHLSLGFAPLTTSFSGCLAPSRLVGTVSLFSLAFSPPAGSHLRGLRGLQGLGPECAELARARLSENERISSFNGKLGRTSSFFGSMHWALLRVRGFPGDWSGEITAGACRCLDALGEDATLGKAAGQLLGLGQAMSSVVIAWELAENPNSRAPLLAIPSGHSGGQRLIQPPRGF